MNNFLIHLAERKYSLYRALYISTLKRIQVSDLKDA